MALQKQNVVSRIPWNKGTGKTPEEKRAISAAYYQKNKESLKDKVRQRYFRNKEKIQIYEKWRHILRTYGLSKEDYKKLELAQNYKCAICEVKPIKVVDHCHSTGLVRGLLCSGCNRDLAILDNPNLLEKALKYKNASKK